MQADSGQSIISTLGINEQSGISPLSIITFLIGVINSVIFFIAFYNYDHAYKAAHSFVEVAKIPKPDMEGYIALIIFVVTIIMADLDIRQKSHKNALSFFAILFQIIMGALVIFVLKW